MQRAFFIAAAIALALPGSAFAAHDAITIGMVLEPPRLDPTQGAAAAIGEVVHLNVFEGLVKLNEDESVAPLLATSWEISSDGKAYAFKLLDGVKFQNGESFTAADVKFTFERDAAADSTNKEKAVFANIAAIDTPDPHTVVLHLKETNPDLLFNLGENTAVILEPKSAGHAATEPVGTGPYRLASWVKGSAITLAKWDGYRDAGKIQFKTATFRIVNDPAAQVTGLLAGDIDAFPRFGSIENLAQFRGDKRFSVSTGTTEGKTIVAINNKQKPFDDLRVRRTLAHAIDRKAIIDATTQGLGVPIGSHYTPNDPGYVDLTGEYPYDPEKAKTLLKEAGVATPLNITLKLPPPAYARQGGEVVAAELAKIGIDAKIENVEWAQWIDGVLKHKNFDLTIISHVEPRDLNIYANPDYYFQYDSPKYREIYQKVATTVDPAERIKWIEAAQRQIAADCVNVFLFVLPQATVTKAGITGFWKNSPIFVNDLANVHWE
jgi:peptide/nickel transport system substrate-binding protein